MSRGLAGVRGVSRSLAESRGGLAGGRFNCNMCSRESRGGFAESRRGLGGVCGWGGSREGFAGIAGVSRGDALTVICVQGSLAGLAGVSRGSRGSREGVARVSRGFRGGLARVSRGSRGFRVVTL